MKSAPHLLGLLGCTLTLFAATPAKPTPAESAQIRQLVAALLQKRQRPEPLPAEPPNPFLLTTVIPGGPGQGRELATAGAEPPAPLVSSAVADAEPAGTAELLARLASRLRIAGIIRLKDQVNIIINDSPWKEGDYLIVNHAGRIVRLQVLRIQAGQLTLRLEEAELVLRF